MSFRDLHSVDQVMPHRSILVKKLVFSLQLIGTAALHLRDLLWVCNGWCMSLVASPSHCVCFFCSPLTSLSFLISFFCLSLLYCIFREEVSGKGLPCLLTSQNSTSATGDFAFLVVTQAHTAARRKAADCELTYAPRSEVHAANTEALNRFFSSSSS